VMTLLLAVQRLLDHQLRELGPVPPRLHVQGEEPVVVSGEQVSAEAVLPGVGIVRAGEGEASARRCVLRDVHVHLLGGEGGGVVIEILDLHLDHADLLVVGEDLQGELAFGAASAKRLPVDALFGVQQAAFAIHVQQVAGLQPGIPAYVPDHRASSLLLRHRVIEVLESQGGSPAEKEATD
uniref:Uncharacterized protein n=1 Tax=Sphenodon punctatus TaxID=8508 RepID=A0A8D0GGU8_SPHPU